MPQAEPKSSSRQEQQQAVETLKYSSPYIPQFEDDPVWHARKIKGDELEVGKKALGIP